MNREIGYYWVILYDSLIIAECIDDKMGWWQVCGIDTIFSEDEIKVVNENKLIAP